MWHAVAAQRRPRGRAGCARVHPAWSRAHRSRHAREVPPPRPGRHSSRPRCRQRDARRRGRRDRDRAPAQRRPAGPPEERSGPLLRGERPPLLDGPRGARWVHDVLHDGLHRPAQPDHPDQHPGRRHVGATSAARAALPGDRGGHRADRRRHDDPHGRRRPLPVRAGRPAWASTRSSPSSRPPSCPGRRSWAWSCSRACSSRCWCSTGFRRAVFEAIPPQLKTAIAVGIGFFLTIIGLADAGIIRPGHPADQLRRQRPARRLADPRRSSSACC